MIAALAALLVAQSPATCRTACGLDAPWVSAAACHELWKLEEVETSRIAALIGFEQEAVCRAWRGWRVKVHVRNAADRVPPPRWTRPCPAPAWNMRGAFCALGYTDTEERTVEVGTSDWVTGALPHELVHVTVYSLFGFEGHCGWWELGILRMLRDITGEDDLSTPEPECYQVAR